MTALPAIPACPFCRAPLGSWTRGAVLRSCPHCQRALVKLRPFATRSEDERLVAVYDLMRVAVLVGGLILAAFAALGDIGLPALLHAVIVLLLLCAFADFDDGLVGLVSRIDRTAGVVRRGASARVYAAIKTAFGVACLGLACIGILILEQGV